MSVLKKRVQEHRKSEATPSDHNATTADLIDEMIGQKVRSPRTTQTAAIVVSDTGEVTLGKFVVSSVGVVIPEDTTEDEWMALLTAARKVKTALQWIISDWAAFGADRQWGTKYDDIAEQTGYKVETLTDMVYVARSVQFSVRTEKLSFTHHKLVAAYLPEQQAELLAQAIQNKWSVKALRHYLETGSPTLPKPGGAAKANPLDLMAKKRDFNQFLRTVSKAGQGDEKARRAALGWLTEQREWLEEIEKVLLNR